MRFANFTLVMLIRPDDYQALDPAEADRVQDAHLAFIADLHGRGLLVAAGPSPGSDERVRGFALMTCDPDTSRGLWASDPGVLAGRFTAVCEPWTMPAEMIVAGATRPPRSMAEVSGS